ncbi:MAG: hypothetical protein JF584_09845, partial [Acidobacteria bacterium]|nr:hypothetical protein [Acidobacteriota bacterium]
MYFEQEGAEEVLRVIIPKGSYIPVFTPRHTAEPVAPVPPVREIPVLPAEVASPPKTRAINSLVPWLLCAAPALALTGVLIRNHATPAAAAAPPPHPLWSQIFQPQQPTLEVPGDSGLVLSHTFDQRNISLNEYLLGDYRTSTFNASTNP